MKEVMRMEDRNLFKAKRLDNKEWVEGALVYDNKDELYRIITEIDYSTGTCVATEKAPRIERFTACQCTGLKDKNGKLIWENDIIKIFEVGEEWCLSKIIFADTSLGCGWKTTDIKSLSKYNNNLFKEVSFGSFDSKSVEVVGNIFDNKELLESEG